MYRKVDEKRADTKLGDAVLSLLKEDAPVNEAMLLVRLQKILVTESDEAYKAATYSAIHKVRAALRMQKSAGTADCVPGPAELSVLAGFNLQNAEFKLIH